MHGMDGGHHLLVPVGPAGHPEQDEGLHHGSPDHHAAPNALHAYNAIYKLLKKNGSDHIELKLSSKTLSLIKLCHYTQNQKCVGAPWRRGRGRSRGRHQAAHR